MMPLMEVLNTYDHHYHIFCDWQMRPRGDKNSKLRADRVMRALTYMEGKVDAVIVPPSIELQMLQNVAWAQQKHPVILPLFTTYLQEFVFTYSIVGKLGLLCEQADLEQAEELIRKSAESYSPTQNQIGLWRKFHQPFALRKKNVRMRTYFLTTYGKREPIVRTTLKHDLRYFHDAAVDTLIPMSRWFLFYQRIVSQRTNRKKIRFHGLDEVKQCFDHITEKQGYTAGEAYSVTVHCTDTTDVLLAEKKWKRILERGKETIVKTINLQEQDR